MSEFEAVDKYRLDCKTGDDIRDAGLTTPDDIKRFDDIRYGDYPENLLDVYVPKGTKSLLPTIISVHGGGWVYGDKELYQHYCMRLAQRGFAVVNYTYRLAPENRYPAAIEDSFKVLEWIKENGSNHHIDVDNLFMVGDSAGGQMAHQICTILANKRYASLFDMAVPDIKIRACGLNCGCYFLCVGNIIPPMEFTMTKYYLPEDYKKYLKQYKVHRYMTKDFPPTFVMTAEEDMLKFMAKPLYRKLKRVGIESEYHVYGEKGNKEIGHVFHVNCRLKEADICNDDECAFFRKHMKEGEKYNV